MVSGKAVRSKDEIDHGLRAWRQGDFTRDHTQLFVLDVSENKGALVIDQEDDRDGIVGMVVVSQTCDIVRDSAERPYVDVSPLVELKPEWFEDARRGRSSRYRVLPGTGADQLGVDLDRTMTVKKAVAAGWTREVGCSTEDERISLARALARKRGRFAFPDKFNAAMSKFNKRVKKQHGKDNPEGRTYNELDQIRVLGSWDESKIETTFFFVMTDGQDRAEVDGHASDLMAKIELPPNYAKPEHRVVMLEDMTGREYQDSVPLEFDHLSEV